MTALQLASLQGCGFPTNILRLPGSSLRALAGYFDLDGAGPVSLDDIRVALQSLLAGFPAIAAITTNVQLGWLDQRDGYPAITLNVVSDETFTTIDAPTEVSLARFQIDVWSESPREAIDLSRAVFDCLQKRAGDIPGGFLYSVYRMSQLDLSEKPSQGSDDWIYRIKSDYHVKYRIVLPDRT